MKKEFDLKNIILTLIGFVMIWAIITNAGGYSEYIFKNNNIGSYIYGYISRLIWCVPALLLIIR